MADEEAQKVFASILRPNATAAEAEAAQQPREKARLLNRKLQLSNVDRPMPKPPAGSALDKQLRKRDRRVTKKWRQALKAEATRKSRDFKRGAHDVVQPAARKPMAKKLALDEVRRMTTCVEVASRLMQRA